MATNVAAVDYSDFAFVLLGSAEIQMEGCHSN